MNHGTSKIYAAGLNCWRDAKAARLRARWCAQAKPGASPKGSSSMLDVIYLLIGAAFLGACVLYAYACDRL